MYDKKNKIFLLFLILFLISNILNHTQSYKIKKRLYYKTVIAIISHFDHDKERKAIQETWMQKNNNETNKKFLFFIGRNDSKKIIIREENIIYLPFTENYRNLTTKVLYSFLFIHFTYDYDYIVKVDDDVYLDVDLLDRMIIKYTLKYNPSNVPFIWENL